MKTRLTLGEKLKDLRNAKNPKLRLSDVSKDTGISQSTLQRMESDEETRFGYQDIEVLTGYYGVSADYLFGLTENRFYRNVEMDKLHISDEAIEVLMNGNLNNKLISELISHEDFQKLLISIQIYIERKIQPQINTMNVTYRYMEKTLTENFEVPKNDEILTFIQESVIDDDEYLRHRISERFNLIMKKMYDSHESDKLPEQPNMFVDVQNYVQTYLETNKVEPIDEAGKAKAIAIAKTIELDTSELSDEEWRVFIKVINKAEKVKRLNKRKKS